ncbi:MAG: hypothetical protein OER74_14765 [Desulfobacteraceae bacterium]|nr:hypothetical protein [Desulfobacteraceae bacterium]
MKNVQFQYSHLGIHSAKDGTEPYGPEAWFWIPLKAGNIFQRPLQAISKTQITFKDKARTDEKAEHTCEYVSILKRLATHL